MSKQLMVIKPGSISPKDKEKLTKNGFIVIEHPEPELVKIIVPTSEIQGDKILMAALYGLQSSDRAKCSFAEDLYKRLKAEELQIPIT